MDRVQASKSSRAESYKKKSSTIDKRYLRSQNRAQECKERRHEKMNLQRNFEDLTPVKENVKESEMKDKLKTDGLRGALVRWKAEKDLKKKLEREKKNQKPVFKVSFSVDRAIKPLPMIAGQALNKSSVKVETKNAISETAKQSSGADNSMPKSSAGGRITRSMTSVSAGKTSHGAVKESALRSSTRSRKVSQKATSFEDNTRSRKASHKSSSSTGEENSNRCTRNRKVPQKSSSSESEENSTRSTRCRKMSKKGSSSEGEGICTRIGKKSQKGSSSSEDELLSIGATRTSTLEGALDSDAVVTNKGGQVGAAESTNASFLNVNLNKVCSTRGEEYSFAPSGFNFKPPENMPDLPFQPVSPASYADFLFPGMSASRSSFSGGGIFKVPQVSAKKKTPKRKNYTNSLILKTLSPEEKDEVILRSPMVETKRRTPKLSSTKKSPVDPLPTFDDIDFDLPSKIDQQALDEAGLEMEISQDLNCPSSQEQLHVIKEEEEPVDSVTVEQSARIDVTNTQGTHTDGMEVDGVVTVDGQHDIGYFRRTVDSEREKLNVLSQKWNVIVSDEEDIPEAAAGQIRATVGQAQLLVVKRFKQFSSLVDDAEFGTGEKAIHSSDLQGFWEVIYFQVEDVHEKFEQLVKLRANKWESDQPKSQKKKVLKKKASSSRPSKPTAAVKSKFADFRVKMKQQKAATDISSTSEDVLKAQLVAEEVRTFDAGFFHVSSPVSSPKYHCEAGTPGKQRPNPSPLHRQAVMKRHSVNRSTGASPHLRQWSSNCDTPNKSLQQLMPNRPLSNTPVKSEEVVKLPSGDHLMVPRASTCDNASLELSAIHNSPLTVVRNVVQSSPSPYRTRRSVLCMPATVTDISAECTSGVFSPLDAKFSGKKMPAEKSKQKQLDDYSSTIDEHLTLKPINTTSIFTPEDSSTPSKVTCKSTRRSLRLQSFSNNYPLSGTPKRRRKGKELLVGNRSLDMKGKENTDEAIGQESRSRRRSSSAPNENTAFNSSLFTPMERMPCPVPNPEDCNELTLPTVDLMSFSPAVQ